MTGRMVFQTLYYLVVAFGTDYLRIISWNFMAMGLIFTSFSIFQALGNTWPSLGSFMLSEECKKEKRS